MSNNDLKGQFYEAVRAYVQRETGQEVTEITGFECGSADSSGCETCSYTVFYTEITYRTPAASWHRCYTVEKSFSNLLDELLEYEPEGEQ